MTTSVPTDRYASGPSPSRLVDVVDVILDKGMVVDFYARACLTDVELVAADGRMVFASMDTFLRLAEAVGGLEQVAARVGAVALPPTTAA
jgi:hypothetical protein